jgi:hypothetical protein
MEKKPPLEPALVVDFVRAAHGDLDKVRALLAEHPTLLHAAWDWGGGDFETSLGAAAHTGGKDVANFLLSKGGRIDVFVAAMLGNLPFVRAVIDAHPMAVHGRGAHGIPLITHAKMGGPDAQGVVD